MEANLLHLAIVVQDEDLVIHPEAPDFSNQDLCEVYVDGNHSGGIGAVFDYASGEDSDFVATGREPAQQYGMVAGPGKYDRFADGNPFLISGNTQASGVQAAVLRLGQTIVYEWAIPLFESFPERRFQIELGKVVLNEAWRVFLRPTPLKPFPRPKRTNRLSAKSPYEN